MRKPKISFLVVITFLFAAFTLGFFLGRSQNRDSITVSVPRDLVVAPTMSSETLPEVTAETEEISFPIAINRAGKEEFMALPGIGEVLADRIIAYRDENGSFSVPEDLLNVEGVGKKRLEEILDLITVGG